MHESEAPRPPMEDALNVPLGKILPRIQDRIMTSTSWMGVPALQSPTDAWVYQQLIFEVQPAAIVEVGTYMGGSTLYLAHLCDLIGHGQIIGIDLSLERMDPRVGSHPRIELLEGMALDLFERVSAMVAQVDGPIMVIEDSSHARDHTLDVCRTYGQLVTPGSYLIVEDTICHHGLDVGPNPGPYEAVEAFLAETDEFVMRRDLEQFVVTWNPTGYLQRV